MKLTVLGASIGIAIAGILFGGGIDRANAATITLYDGATFSGTPDLAPGSYLTFNSFDPLNLAPPGTQTAGGGKTTLDTSSPERVYGGYTNYISLTTPNAAFPVLDSDAGYTLSFTIKINSQTNTGANGSNRAGFSVTALDKNKKGIEIGFRNTDIFAQNSNFNAIDPAEQITGYGTTLASPDITYELKVLGNSYTLSNGGTNLFSGLLRSYIISPSNPLTAVYGNPNFLFFGDNTTSAGASVDIQKITLTTNSTAVPEPSEALGTLVAVGLGALLKRKLNRSNPQKSDG
jgi:hypothetical protein